MVPNRVSPRSAPDKNLPVPLAVVARPGRWRALRAIATRVRGRAQCVVRGLVLIAILITASLTSLVPAVGAENVQTACAGELWLDAPMATPEAGAASPTASEHPAWMTTELTDACSGETFKLTEFAGKTLYVESMATWCGECYEQLTRVKQAFAQIPEARRNEIVFVALSSEIDLSREDLAAYADNTGFPLLFAVMPEIMLKAMVEDIGREWAIPPAMPHLIIAADGTIGDLRTGGSSVDELVAMFKAEK